jgi:hypothetical protein
LKKTVVRMPGPSWMENFLMSKTIPVVKSATFPHRPVSPCSVNQRSTFVVSTSRGMPPFTSMIPWNSRTSNRGPSVCSANVLNSRILISPIWEIPLEARYLGHRHQVGAKLVFRDALSHLTAKDIIVQLCFGHQRGPVDLAQTIQEAACLGQASLETLLGNRRQSAAAPMVSAARGEQGIVSHARVPLAFKQPLELRKLYYVCIPLHAIKEVCIRKVFLRRAPRGRRPSTR